MTENETQTVTLPNGVTVTTLSHPTWDVKAYRQPGAATSKVIAVSPDRGRAMHRDKVADAALATVADELAGTAGPRPARVDIAAQMMAGK